MTLDPDRVETVTIDSYSTVVDVDAAERALVDHVEDPSAVARLWRGRSLTYASMSNYLGRYEPFWGLLDRALEYALAAHGADLPAATREGVLAVYRDLDAFDDVRPGLERVVDAGYDCYVLSNGSPDMLSAMVERAGVEDLIADAISADEVKAYKPAAEIYRHAAARTGTPARGIVHASAGWFDAVGAKNVGMQGVWLNRDGSPPETWGPEPDGTVSSFEDLADAIA